ncbi:Predicted NAD/FAD-binding protein [Solimonas aquatica]|uniref:Predicted NAD/FAD-binding protein n=1 Tax=Solimonas aquatica TaxID=489703 RepID=A0A1H9F789_9GAMM|nr:FAD-dependent oxidoreductase [Solimonas aquatica]SEQ33802.1 Predicted NAD/FAD-binding protein [Solimonas aquatica]
MKIAVVGAGIAGLSAAYLLARRHQVVLFEAHLRPGGHSNTVEVDTGEGTLAVDTGFIVCNPVNYPNFYALLDELRVPRQDTDMSLGVSVEDGRVEWAGDENLLKIFAQPSLIFSPAHIRMLLAITRFNAEVKKLLAADALPEITLGEFLERGGYPMSLRLRYVAAMAGPIWSSSTAGVMAFPFPAFARFFESHGLLNVYQRPQWQTVVGGSQRYVEALLQRFEGQVRCATPVQSLRRSEDGGVLLSSRNGEERFDRVVCATHSDQALRLLADADVQERALLGDVPYARNKAWLHTDVSLMPRRRAVWSSWNALLPEDRLSDAPIGVSYWMNQLQRLPGKTPLIVSLNPPHDPAEGSVLYQTEYAHPQYTPATIAAQAQLPALQNRRGIVWAGAWTGYGFHEDGLKSGLRAVAALDRDCLPQWGRL